MTWGGPTTTKPGASDPPTGAADPAQSEAMPETAQGGPELRDDYEPDTRGCVWAAAASNTNAARRPTVNLPIIALLLRPQRWDRPTVHCLLGIVTLRLCLGCSLRGSLSTDDPLHTHHPGVVYRS